jgi:hypothetical protein
MAADIARAQILTADPGFLNIAGGEPARFVMLC